MLFEPEKKKIAWGSETGMRLTCGRWGVRVAAKHIVIFLDLNYFFFFFWFGFFFFNSVKLFT